MKAERLVLVLLIPLLFAAATHAAVLSGPSLNTSLLYYQPLPASPGSLLDVYVQISNDGETARNVEIEFVDNAPFSLSSEADRVKTLPTIPGNENALLKYKVRVSQDATPGTSFIKLRYGNGGQQQTVNLPIDIFTNTVSVNLEQLALEPQSFVPGGVGRISFNLQNGAPIKIREGTVTLELASTDIVPVSGTNQQRFTDLQVGEMRKFTFTLAPSPNMAPGIYRVPINITFSDQQGRTYQRTELIGVRVGSVPDISVTIDDSKVTAEQRTGDVTIRVTNKGLGEIKFVDLQLGDSESFELLSGSKERYIGNIDSDDYKTARVMLEAKGDQLQIPVTVTYMDALNTPYNETTTLSVPVRKTGNGGPSMGVIVGIVIVAALAGYFFFRRRKNK